MKFWLMMIAVYLALTIGHQLDEDGKKISALQARLATAGGCP